MRHQSGSGALRTRTRFVLLSIALVQIGLFALAARLPVVDEAGRPRTMGTHELLGLPPCVFHKLTGLPCPSCGLTTSFCHFVRGDLVHSLKANAAGTLLATLCLASIPWCVHGAASGCCAGLRRVPDLERALLIGVVALFSLLFVNWGIRLGLSVFE